MTGATLTVRVSEDRITSALEEVLAAADDLTPALKNIGEYFRERTIERIKTETSPDGKKFAPLNPLYAKVEKKGPGILRGESGQLSAIVYQLAGDSVEIGNNIPYGAIHQFGGTIKAKNAPALVFQLGGNLMKVQSVEIPARSYLGVDAQDETETIDILRDHFDPEAD
jgi:phage virion morphogenesis protein